MFGDDAEEQALLKLKVETARACLDPHLLLLLILEPECCLDAASLVQESSPHVDIADVPEVPASQVDAEVEHDVRHQLLGVPRPLALHILELVIDVVVGDDGGHDGDGGHEYSDTADESLPGYWEKQIDEEEIED